MESLKWCDSYQFMSKGIAEEVKEEVKRLIKTKLSNKDDYATEKFIKIYCEQLIYLENSLYYKEGIHHEQYQNDPIKMQQLLSNYENKQEEILKILQNENKRIARHFQMFL